MRKQHTDVGFRLPKSSPHHGELPVTSWVSPQDTQSFCGDAHEVAHIWILSLKLTRWGQAAREGLAVLAVVCPLWKMGVVSMRVLLHLSRGVAVPGDQRPPPRLCEVIGTQRPNVAKKWIGSGQVLRAKPSLLAQPFRSALLTVPSVSSSRNLTAGSPGPRENCSHQNPSLYWKATPPLLPGAVNMVVGEGPPREKFLFPVNQ